MKTGTTLGQAVKQYFRDNGFGENGGYDDAWVDFELGPIPLPFPNTAGRKWAVRYHDLHHILTGYQTDTIGELEISAWELGADCTKSPAAVVINSGGMFTGLLAAPKRTYRAFLRGRASSTLYAERYEDLLEETVEEARAKRIGEARAATAEDIAWFVAHGVLGLLLGLVMLALFLPLVPIGLVNVMRMRRAKAAAARAAEQAVVSA